MKTKFSILFLLVYSTVLFASEDFAMQEPSRHLSVTADEFIKGPCRVPTYNINLYKYLSSIEENTPAAEKVDFSKYGIVLKNQSKILVDALEAIITPEKTSYELMQDLLTKPISSEQKAKALYFKDFLKENMDGDLMDMSTHTLTPFRPSAQSYDFTLQSKNCESVLCVAKNIFGEKQAALLLYIKIKFDVNASHLQGHIWLGTEHVSPWTVYELFSIWDALEQFPENFRLNKYDFRPKHFDRNPNLSGNQTIRISNANGLFYNKWNELGPALRSVAFSHEFFHRLAVEAGFNYNTKRTKVTPLDLQWMAAAHWEHSLEGDKNIKPQEAPSQYALSAVSEDLIESLNAYLLAPEYLLKKSPSRYQFLKEHFFKNKEFRAGACSR